MLDPSKQQFQLGTALLLKGDLDSSIAAFTEATRLDPDYRVAHYQLGVALQRKGAHTEAIAAFRRAIRLDPAYVEAYVDLGEALFPDRLGEASAVFHEAVRLNPHHARAHLGLGRVLVSLDSPCEAEKEFRSAISLDPDLAQAHVGLGHLLLQRTATATLFQRLLRGPELLRLEAETLAAFRQALHLQPSCAAARVGIGDVLLAQGHTSRARAQYEEAIRQGEPPESLQSRLSALPDATTS
jgi:tetratricopeptide (TPR) repeat protein